jgi:hypothetical protein
MSLIAKAWVQFDYVRDRIQGKAAPGRKRSPEWRVVRAQHLELWPFCAACDGTKGLQVHHIYDFSNYPHLELDFSNFVTLCTKGKYGISDCHLFWGHHGYWARNNFNVLADINDWRKSINKEPLDFSIGLGCLRTQ